MVSRQLETSDLESALTASIAVIERREITITDDPDWADTKSDVQVAMPTMDDNGW